MSAKFSIVFILAFVCTMSSIAFAVEPITQASAPVVSSVGPSSMTLSWTSGNGAGRIIIVRQGSDLTQDPADGISYGGLGTFPYGTGSTISAGHFVAYKGTGSTVTVTGLSPGTAYYFKVYEYNGSAGSTDYLLPGLSITQATATPTITITGAVADFGNVPLGGLSSQKSYSVSGANLYNDDIYITPPSGFQVSRTGGGGFSSENPLVLTQSSGTVNSTTIYVKYSPSSAGLQSGNITHESYSATTINQPVSGTGIAEPTTVSTFVSSTSTPSSITLTWSGGNGTSKLVVIKSGSAVSGTPGDATTYTANTQFNNGQSTLNAGEYVVFSSTGTSVTVTGLNAGTEYYFKIFEYNGSGGGENYLTSSAMATSKTTLASEPTSQASSVTFDNVGSTSMRINWSVGNGSNRIVVLRSGSAVTAVPADTVAYTADAAFGTGAALISAGQYVVYNSSGTSVTVTGLSPSTTYYAAFYDYNGSARSANYLTTSPATANQLTATPTITVSAVSLASFGDVAVGQTSAVEKSYTVSGTNLTNNITVTPPAGFIISETSGSGFVSSAITLTQSGGTVNSTTIYVKFSPVTGGAVSSNITNTSLNATQKNVAGAGTGIAEPTSASTFVSTTSTPGTVTLTWAIGNGENRIAVVRSGSSVLGNPSDASTYTANAQFNNGQSVVAAGEYVVYNSTGTSVTVTGLSAGTEYFFKVFEYNGSGGGENYLTSSAMATSKTTLASEPTTQASGVTFDNVGPTSMRINWSNGDGSSRIVVLRSGSAVTAVPTDTVAYTANAAFGTGSALISAGQYVVYNGSGTSVTVTGLSPSTTYYAAFYDYNGSLKSSNYLTTSPATANQLTATPTITVSSASLASFGEIAGGQTSAEKSYAVSGSNLTTDISINPPTGYEISTGTGGGFTATSPIILTPSSGTVNSTTIYVRFAPSVSASGTVSGNIVQSSTNAASKNVAVTGVSVGEPATATTFVSSSSTPNTITLTWINGGGENRIVVVRSVSAVTGSPSDASTYTANTQFNNGQSTLNAGEYVVYNSTGTSVTVTGLNAGTVYYFKVFEYNGSGGGENYLTSSVMTASKTTLASEPTSQASTVTFDNIGPAGMRINWANGDGSNRIVVLRSGSAVTAVPTDSVTYSANSIFSSGEAISSGQRVVYNGSGTSVTVTGLSSSTTYYIALYDYNGSTKSSNYLTTSPATGSQATAIPTITVSAVSLSSFGDVAVGQTSVAEKTYSVSGANLTNNITITPPEGYLISETSGSGFSASAITLTQVLGTVSSTPIYVKFSPITGGAVTGNITHVSTPATSKNVAVTGNGIGEPTQVSNLSISSLTHNSVKLSWTNGGGASRIVLAKLTSAVNADPVDATTYTGNSSFGSGNQIGTGNYIVYIGSNDTITVTGLSSASQYYFSVYEFSGSSGAENYTTTAPAVSNATTLASPPTDQPTGISFSSVTSTQMNISWTKGTGAASSLVLIREGSAVSGNPVDAQSYTANAIYGSGTALSSVNYVVYSTSGTNVTVTNLTPAVTYHVSVFAYNGSANTSNYLTSAPLTGSQLTATPLITVTGGPLAFGSVQVGATSAVQSYTVAGSNLTNDIGIHPSDQYEVSLSSGAGYKTNGQTLTVSQSGGTVNSTTIYVRYKPTSSGSANSSITHTTSNGSDQTLNVTGTGIGEPTLAASNVVFSSVTTSSMTIGWTIGDGTKRVVLIKSGSPVDGDPVDGTTYTSSATFGSGTEIGTGNYTIYNSSSNSVTINGLTPNTVYYAAVYEYKGTSGNENYLLVNPGTGIKTTLASQPGTQSTALSFTTVGPKSLTLSFTKGNGTSRVVVMKAGNAVDADPVDATAYSANTLFGSGTQIGSGNYVVYNGTGNSVSVSNLLVNTTYHVAVYEYNGSGEAINYLTPSTAVENTATTTPTITVSKTTLTDFGNVIVGTNSSEQSYTVSGANLLSNITVTPPTGLQISTTSGSGFTTNAITLTPVSGTVISTTIYARFSPLSGGAVSSSITNASDSVTTKTVTVSGTGVAEPTAQSTALTFTERTTTTMKLSWTKGAGTGTRSLVIAREASSVSGTPVDASTYVANAAIGSGAQIGAENYVVYNSTGSTVTVTGLKTGTAYYFAVYEFNGPADGVENYLATSPLTGNNSTLTTTPLTAAGNIVFSNVTTSSMTIGWTNGDGTKRVVLIKSGNPVDGNPVDGSTYTSSATVGNGTEIGTGNYTVYNSSSNSVTVSGLSPNTVYYAAVYEYKGTAGIENYLVDNPGTGSKTTLASLPSTQSSALAFTAVGSKNFTLNWTKGNGASRLVVMKALTAVDSDPVASNSYSANTVFGSGTQIGSGNYVVYNGTGNSVSVSNLSINTTYHVAVYEYNGSGEASNYLMPTTATENTLTGTPAITVSTVSLTSFGSIPVLGSSSEKTYTVSGSSLTNDITITAPTDYQISLTSGSGFASSITLPQVSGTVASTTIYAKFLPASAGSVSGNITHTSTNASQKNVAVTGSGISEPLSASRFVSSTATSSSITLTWLNGDGENRLVVVKSGSAVSAAPVDGATYTASAQFNNGQSTVAAGEFVTYNGNGTSVTVTGLTAGTTYYFKVFDLNGTAGGENYLTSSALSAGKMTLASEPTTQTQSVSFDNVGPLSIRINWSNGNGSNRIVVMKSGSAVTAAPADTVAYTPNSAFLSGEQIVSGERIVYGGSGSSVTVTGLSFSTTYHVAVYEYNGTGKSTNYLTTSPATGNTTTTIPSITLSKTTLTDFGNVIVGTNSSEQSYTVSGANLLSNITVTPPTGLQISTTSGSGFTTNAITLTPVSGTVISTTIYARFSPLSGGAVSSSITNASDSVTTKTVTVSGTGVAEPTAQSTALTFTERTTTTMKLSWTKGAGTGTRSLVIAREASSVSGTPVDASTYVANAAIGSGAQIGAENYVVYNSTSSTVTVTGLKTGTAYYFAVYEFNGPADGVENYLTTSPLTGSGVTLSTEPTIAAGNVVFSNVTTSSMTIGWNNGDGTKRIVVIKSTPPIYGDPVDGTTYTASTTYGSGTEVSSGNFTVYNSISNSVTVSGLSPNTVYYAAVYEYKGTAGNENYLLENPGTGSKTTLASQPGIQSTALSFTTVGPKSLTLSFTKGNGASRVVVMKAGNVVDSNPVDAISYNANTMFGSGTQIGSGNYVVYNGTGNSVSVSNLLINTTYHVAVYEYNGSGEAINYLTPSTAVENTTTTTPSITLSKTTLTNFGSVIIGTNSSEQNYTASGTNLLSNITVTPPTGFQISTTAGTNFDTAAITLSPVNGTVASTIIYSRFSPKSSGSVSKMFTHTSDSAVTKTVTVGGNGVAAAITVSGVITDFGKVVVNEVSSVQSYKVSADNIAGNLLVTPPSGFQISRTGQVFTPVNSIVLTPVNTAIAPTDIFVRFAPAAEGNFLDSIIHSTAGTSNVCLSVSGAGIVKPTTGDSALEFSSIGPKTITVSWKKGNGVNRIVVVKEKSSVDALPEDNTTYTANALFGQSSEIGMKNYVVYNGTGTYVTVSGLQPNTKYYFSIYPYNGSPGSEKYLTDNVGDSSQSTAEPSIVITGALGSFGNVHAGEISSIQNYSVSGTNLVNGISIIPPAGFQVSLSASGPFVGSNSSLALSPNNQTVDPTSIYVRCTPLSGGEKRDSISHVSSGSTTRYATVSAYSIVEPTISSSSILFSSVKPTSMTITWKKGNGTKHLVFLGTDSIGGTLPEDRMYYPSSFQYGEGASLTSNMFAVQSDSSNTVSVTHLSPNKKYYCAVFEYNGDSAAADYLTSSYVSASQMTGQPVMVVQSTFAPFGMIERNTTSGEQIYTVSGTSLMNNIVITPPAGFQLSLTSGTDFRSLNPITLINADGTVLPTTIYVRFAPTVVRVYSDSIIHSSAGATTIFTLLTGSCMASEPTKQASSIVVSSISSSSAAVVCTEGNGYSRIIIISKDTLSGHLPADGKTYAADPAFMVGALLDSNSSVAYSGNGISCILTGLLPDTKNVVTIFEYNGEAGTENYLTSTKIQKEFVTMVESPVPQTPVNKAIDQSSTPLLVWKKVRNAQKYIVQVAFNKEYTGTVYTDTADIDTTLHVPITHALKYDTLYYWRVAGINDRGRGDYSAERSFRTASPPKLIAGASRIDFGPKQIQKKYGLTVVVRNNSVTPLTLDSVHVNSAAFAAVISSPTLTRNDSSIVTITFGPDSIGAYADTVVVYNNSVDRLLRIPVTGNAPAPLFASKNIFDLQEVQVQQKSEKSFPITNISPNVLRIDSITNRLRQIVVAVDSFPIFIALGDTFRLKLRCIPDSLKELTDTLFAYANGKPVVCKVVMKAHATNVSKEDEQAPAVFTLQQNFPNPFNPSTTIKFGLTQDAIVSLKMYDILGRQVGMLLNDNLLTPGSYRYIWDAAHLPSGVYFYQIIAASVNGNVKTIIFREVRKLLLVK